MSETAAAAASDGGDFGASRNKLGMWLFLCADAMMFAALFGGYAMVRIASGAEWPVPKHHLNIPLTAVFTFVLIISSVTMVKAFEAADRDDPWWLKFWLFWTILLGLSFIGFQTYEWTELILHGGHVPWRLGGAENLFYATFFTLTGFHGFHVTCGVLYNSTIFFNAFQGKYDGGKSEGVEVAGLYWHFVDLVWILLFTFIYLI